MILSRTRPRPLFDPPCSSLDHSLLFLLTKHPRAQLFTY